MLRLAVEGRHVLSCAPGTIFHALRSGTLPVKDRHVYTRAGRLRLRYVALIAAGFLGIASTNLSWTQNEGIDIAQAQAGMVDVAAIHANPRVVAHMAAASGISSMAMIAPLNEIEPSAPASASVALVPASIMAPVVPAKPLLPANFTRTLTIKSGDTLSDVMEEAALESGSAATAIAALKDHINPKELKPGQDVTMHYDRAGGAAHLTAMEFAPTPLTRVILRQGAGGAFKVEKTERSLSREVRAARATIRTSLYADLRTAGVPDSIIADFIKVYSYNVDFGRDIWAGDRVELLYDVNKTDDGDFVRGEQLTYAALYLRGKAHVIFRFDHDGSVEYFDAMGNPIKKALMRTPIDGARVTSSFGRRKHPILGYTKMHKGIDFGAPTGTPIFAAGDGTVVRAGWVNGYGKYVSIKHNGTYSTAYAHMSAIGVKPGQRVRQGQVIGRVGTTGNSTGPHLHFEVMQNGTQINPVKLASMSIGNKLGGKQMARFQSVAASAKNSFNGLINSAAKLKLASTGGE